MPRPSSLSPDNILRFLQVTHGEVSANEIAAGLHLGKAERKGLFKMLAGSAKAGGDCGAAGGAVPVGGAKTRRGIGGKRGSGCGGRRGWLGWLRRECAYKTEFHGERSAEAGGDECAGAG